MKRTAGAIIAMVWIGMLINSCKKDTKISPSASPQYNLHFTVSAGSTPLIINQNVNNAPLHYNVNSLRFYLGNARLEKSDGTEVPLSGLLVVQYDDNIDHSPVYGQNFNFPYRRAATRE